MVDEMTFTSETKALLSMMYRISMSMLHIEADAQDAMQQGAVAIAVSIIHNAQRFRRNRLRPMAISVQDVCEEKLLQQPHGKSVLQSPLTTLGHG